MAATPTRVWALLSLLLLFQGGAFGRRSFAGSRDECQLRRIKAFEPSLRVEAEGGVTEVWDPLNEQFRSIRGADQHQKIGTFEKGDIIVFPEGAAHWVANTGKDDVVLIVIQDTSNSANQLDANPLRFFLAGNGQSKEEEMKSRRQKHGKEEEEEEEEGSQRSEQQLLEGMGYGGGNILGGFRSRYVRDSFRTDKDTAENLQGAKDGRGHIVRLEAEDLLSILAVPFSSPEDDNDRSAAGNGVEETICTARVRQNIDDSSRADISDPLAGYFFTVNKYTLPIFGLVKLSAGHGSLKRNWGIVPKWCMNAHSYVYVMSGSARVQIVDNRGDSVMDDEVRRGQLFLVPQNFVVAMEAGEDGFEWVEFNTNDDAMFNTLAGTTSVVAGFPAGIVAAAYRLPHQKAEELKRDMLNSVWFFKSSSSGGGMRSSYRSILRLE
ncbi:unnamed protein product [Cuscuta campestris]|uniref:Cupin type-1 domain-containing protein n=1 Tax=Cuscuta campestris TaxID=132261 RepID=A0A484NHY2_9ASTE|nr:unnamed protein product [Cuscuta campestris]